MTNSSLWSRRRFFMAGTIAAAGFSFARNARASEPRVVVPSYNTFTDEEEVQLGKTFDRKMTEEARFVADPFINGYVNDMVQKLSATSRRTNLRYSARVIDVAEVNASAVPGGFLYVQRGMLDLVQEEHELAAVLAHEVGHVVAHHGTNKLAAIFIGKSFYELVKKEVLHDQEIVAGVLEKLGGALFLLTQLKYSRSAESDADLLGYYNMQRAGWHPDGMLSMFRRLLAHSSDPNFVQAIFSTHPPTAERIQAVQHEMREAPPAGELARNSGRFQQMKSALAKLPPPQMKKMPH